MMEMMKEVIQEGIDMVMIGMEELMRMALKRGQNQEMVEYLMAV